MNRRTALGLDIFGRPFYGFRGAEAEDSDGGDPNGEEGTEVGSDGLTAAGRRLIETERNTAKEAKRALGPWRKLERELEMSPDQIREALAARGNDEKQLDEVRREAERSALQKVNARLVRAEVRALATADFQDPEDAYAFIDLNEIDVDAEGNVDVKAVQAALKDVLRRKPHLAKKSADDGDTTNFDGGARRSAAKPQNMTDVIRGMANRKRGIT